MEKEMKILFSKIGTEKAPEDFTALVMNKIEAKKPYSLSLQMTKNSYWFLLPYLIAMLITLPFIIPTINWVINIDWSFISFDISFVREWIGSLRDSFSGITIPTHAIIISLVCSVILLIFSIEVLTQSRRRILN